MTPQDILQRELEHQLSKLTHVTLEGVVYCRNRHGADHGWHAPGSKARDEKFEGGAILACQHCQNYNRIKLALSMAGVANPGKRCVVRAATRWVSLGGKSHESQDEAYASSVLYAMKSNISKSSFRFLKRLREIRGERMYSAKAVHYEHAVAARLEQRYRHLDSKTGPS